MIISTGNSDWLPDAHEGEVIKPGFPDGQLTQFSTGPVSAF
jgi:hypothetical protein